MDAFRVTKINFNNGIKINYGIIQVLGVEGNGLKVKPAVKLHGGNDVLESGNVTLNTSDRWNPGICVVGGEERPAAAFGVMVTGRGSRG